MTSNHRRHDHIITFLSFFPFNSRTVKSNSLIWVRCKIECSVMLRDEALEHDFSNSRNFSTATLERCSRFIVHEFAKRNVSCLNSLYSIEKNALVKLWLSMCVIVGREWERENVEPHFRGVLKSIKFIYLGIYMKWMWNYLRNVEFYLKFKFDTLDVVFSIVSSSSCLNFFILFNQSLWNFS